jgi:hypothetical protein
MLTRVQRWGFAIRLLCALPVLAVPSFSAPAAVIVRVPVWIESPPALVSPTFEATVNGKPAAINTLQDPLSDQVILLVLDLTGDLAFIDPAEQALTSEIGKLPNNAWVGLLRAQDGLRVLADPAADRQPVFTGIRELSASGKSGLLDTVESALSLADAMMRKSPARVAVLYVTDSDIANYREDYTNPVINQSDPHDLSRRFPEALINEKISKLSDAASTLQPPLFIVHLNYRRDRLNLAYQNGLKTLAETTAGEIEVCRSTAEIPEAVSRIFTRISAAWSLTLTLPPKIQNNAQVRLTAHQGDSELRLNWRTRFAPRPPK